MKAPRSRVISARVPVTEFIEMVTEAETRNCSVAEVLLSSWRDRKSREPVEVQLRKIELELTKLQADQSFKFQRLADAFNQLIITRK